MADKNTADMAQQAAASAREAAGKGYNAAQQYASKGYDSAREYANRGYDSARDYAGAGVDMAARMGENLGDFVRREPWIAIGAAFAVGYVAARLMRRLSL